ncbi:hypothetical protein M8J76_005212 [Diaphorina citri]|nr:hypothetical protein M8J75_010021 [Diaphorina citri]KAI5744795.1 hypothetical protein M8J76_005212 [Diaphorina citri]
MQNMSEDIMRSSNEDQQETVPTPNVPLLSQNPHTNMLPNVSGMRDTMVPLIPFTINYPATNVPFAINYPVSRPVPSRLPVQCPTYHMNVHNALQKRPVPMNSASTTQVSLGSGLSTHYATHNSSQNDNYPLSNKRSQETSLNQPDASKVSDESAEGPSILKTTLHKSEMKGALWSSRTEGSTPMSYSLLQPQPAHLMTPTPNCFIPLPLMCPNQAIKFGSPQYQRIQMNHCRTNVDTVYKSQGDTPDRPQTFTTNHWFEDRNKTLETNTHRGANALKTQIMRNVEQLFELATSKVPTKAEQEANLDKTSKLKTSEDQLGNIHLMETVMKCCIEVETYWTERTTDCTPRDLILGCCKSIRSLISNDIRQNAEASIVSSLQELTLSLILLFLISSLK